MQNKPNLPFFDKKIRDSIQIETRDWPEQSFLL
jgi:hypothetical protein